MAEFYDTQGRWRALPEDRVEALNPNDACAYEMGELAAQAAQEAQERWQRKLDYQPESVKDLEYILSDIYAAVRKRNSFFGKLTGKSLSEDAIWQAGFIWGSYLGEVLRIQLGFEWTYGDYAGGDIVHMRRGPSSACAPHSKVFKRLADGPGDEIPAYYWLMTEQFNQTS